MYVFNETPTCVHVSSVNAYDPDIDEWVEAGWIDIANGYPYHDDNCSITGDGHPMIFRTWKRQGHFYCDTYGDIATTNLPYEFEVIDQNVDETWAFAALGNWIGGTVTTDFSLSHSLTNGERYGDIESADARFNGLQYMPPNGAWTPWGDSHCYAPSDDPMYHNQLLSATHVTVSTSPPAC